MPNHLKKNPLLAFTVPGLFLLAASIDLAGGVFPHHQGPSSANLQTAGLLTGSMFATVGVLWLAVSLRWRKQAARPGREDG